MLLTILTSFFIGGSVGASIGGAVATITGGSVVMGSAVGTCAGTGTGLVVAFSCLSPKEARVASAKLLDPVQAF